jgi:hypothetical protein
MVERHQQRPKNSKNIFFYFEAPIPTLLCPSGGRLEWSRPFAAQQQVIAQCLDGKLSRALQN